MIDQSDLKIDIVSTAELSYCSQTVEELTKEIDEANLNSHRARIEQGRQEYDQVLTKPCDYQKLKTVPYYPTNM